MGIGLAGYINDKYFVLSDNLFLIGSFGASAVLIYGLINIPLAQPRNLIGEHLIKPITGVTMYKIFTGEVWLSPALAIPNKKLR